MTPEDNDKSIENYAVNKEGFLVEIADSDISPLISDQEFAEAVLPKDFADFFAAKDEIPWSCGKCPAKGVEKTFAEALQKSLRHDTECPKQR